MDGISNLSNFIDMHSVFQITVCTPKDGIYNMHSVFQITVCPPMDGIHDRQSNYGVPPMDWIHDGICFPYYNVPPYGGYP